MKIEIKKGIDVDINGTLFNVYLSPTERFEVVKIRQEIEVLSKDISLAIEKEIETGIETPSSEYNKFLKKVSKAYDNLLKLFFKDKIDKINELVYVDNTIDITLANQIIEPLFIELSK